MGKKKTNDIFTAGRVAADSQPRKGETRSAAISPKEITSKGKFYNTIHTMSLDDWKSNSRAPGIMIPDQTQLIDCTACSSHALNQVYDCITLSTAAI